MLTEEEFYKESIDANLYYLRTLRDFCINIALSFYGNNPYKERSETLAKKSQDLGREIVTLTNGKVPSKGFDYKIFYTEYTLPTEKLTEKLFNINIATDITESQLELTPTDTFEITDERLLNKTNGIVQGMSGSPIIQNNKIVGAVTHVFVDDVTKGYGIYIDWMLEQIKA